MEGEDRSIERHKENEKERSEKKRKPATEKRALQTSTITHC